MTQIGAKRKDPRDGILLGQDGSRFEKLSFYINTKADSTKDENYKKGKLAGEQVGKEEYEQRSGER